MHAAISFVANQELRSVEKKWNWLHTSNPTSMFFYLGMAWDRHLIINGTWSGRVWFSAN